MDRESPRTISNELDLYIRTYYSLLRTSSDVRVRAFEEAHIHSNSSLHADAQSNNVDLAAFAYSAARLPSCMIKVTRLILGQSTAQFERAGYPVSSWKRVRSRGRRRLQLWDGAETLAVFVTSASDIDDLIPIVTAYQIEWNKMNNFLSSHADTADDSSVKEALRIDDGGLRKLQKALDADWQDGVRYIAKCECDLSVRLLDGSLREYRRTARQWWQNLQDRIASDAPVYFVSSNSHSLANLLGGYSRTAASRIEQFIRDDDPENLTQALDDARADGDTARESNIMYYALRAYLHQDLDSRLSEVNSHDEAHGIVSVPSPGGADVGAQIIDLSKLNPKLMDDRICVDGVDKLVESNAIIVNIDYPLGLAAYHHLAEVSLGVQDLRGVYVMGKAATLNGRVGDVMISEVVFDEHSRNTYVFNNPFSARHIAPYMQRGTVLDNQKAVTVRSAFLQNRDYMGVFYQEGYTVLEMEGGPYLSSVYENVSPKRHPSDQIVRLSSMENMEIGIIHYASDTPYSRRQELLSKSLSYFGVDATYASAIAIVRRILSREIGK